MGRAIIHAVIAAMCLSFEVMADEQIRTDQIRKMITETDAAAEHRDVSGIGKYFTKYPQDRQKVFLVSKSDARDTEGMTRLLDRSLERRIRVSKLGSRSYVVWNPWAETGAKFGDMGEDGYRHMLCVESAAVRNPVVVPAGEEWYGRQTLVAV